MQIDNQTFLTKIKTRSIYVFLFLLATGITLEFLPVVDELLFEYSRYAITGSILILYILYNIFRLSKKYYFVQFDDSSSDLIIRFYHIRRIGKKRKAYKIPLDQIYDYTIENKKLTITQQVGNKRGKLPEVSLTAYNAEQISKVKEMLDTYIQKK